VDAAPAATKNCLLPISDRIKLITPSSSIELIFYRQSADTVYPWIYAHLFQTGGEIVPIFRVLLCNLSIVSGK